MLRPWLGVVLLLCACDGKTLIVESDTSWAGTIGATDVSDQGNAQFDISGSTGQVCWTLAKTTSQGTLRAYAKDDTWFGLGSEIDGESTTIAPNGTVTGCAQ
jgi:hypothetical protein